MSLVAFVVYQLYERIRSVQGAARLGMTAGRYERYVVGVDVTFGVTFKGWLKPCASEWDS